ncbi:MAG: site-2 protease family protein [Actinomycetota bacterium]
MQRKRGLRLGRPFGSPLLVHRSWLGAGALLIVHLAFTMFGAESLPLAIALGTAAVAGVFVSVVVHEAAHELARRRIGVHTEDVTLFVFGGVPRTLTETARPRDEVTVALAGLVTTGAVAAGCFVGADYLTGNVDDVVRIVAVANVVLAGANLLPGLPFDGGRLLASYLWKRRGDRAAAVRTTARTGVAWGVAAVLSGAWLTVTSLRAAADAALGLWLVLVGVFVVSEASRTGRSARVAGILAGGTAGSWARPFAGRLKGETLVPADGGPYAVSDGPRLAGILMPAALDVGRGRPAREVMIPWTPDIALPSDASTASMLEQLAASAAGVLVVLDHGGVVRGVIDTDGVRARLGGS